MLRNVARTVRRGGKGTPCLHGITCPTLLLEMTKTHCEECDNLKAKQFLIPVHHSDDYKWLCEDCAEAYKCEIHDDHCSEPVECIRTAVGQEMIVLSVNMPHLLLSDTIAIHVGWRLFPAHLKLKEPIPLTDEILDAVNNHIDGNSPIWQICNRIKGLMLYETIRERAV